MFFFFRKSSEASLCRVCVGLPRLVNSRSRVSHVTCHLSQFFLQSFEAYQWRVCYQRAYHIKLTLKRILKLQELLKVTEL